MIFSDPQMDRSALQRGSTERAISCVSDREEETTRSSSSNGVVESISVELVVEVMVVILFALTGKEMATSTLSIALLMAFSLSMKVRVAQQQQDQPKQGDTFALQLFVLACLCSVCVAFPRQIN